jgi:hypothetical protein
MNQIFTKPRDIFNQINMIFMTIVLVTDGLWNNTNDVDTKWKNWE